MHVADITNVTTVISAFVIRTRTFYLVQFTGNIGEGDYAVWVSLNYALHHPGTECGEASNRTAFSVTNLWANPVDGKWDGTLADHGGLITKREEPPGSGKFAYLSDLTLINEGDDTLDPFAALEDHAPAGTYQLCLAKFNSSVATSIGANRTNRRQLARGTLTFEFFSNVYVVVHQRPPSQPPPSSPSPSSGKGRRKTRSGRTTRMPRQSGCVLSMRRKLPATLPSIVRP